MPDLDRLLERTSRTFALSIPRLPEPTRSQDDGSCWPRSGWAVAASVVARTVVSAEPGTDSVARGVAFGVAWDATGSEGVVAAWGLRKCAPNTKRAAPRNKASAGGRINMKHRRAT